MDAISQTTSSSALKFVPKGPINNIPALVQIMAWRLPGDKPLSEPMMVSLLTHICVTRSQWVKTGDNVFAFSFISRHSLKPSWLEKRPTYTASSISRLLAMHGTKTSAVTWWRHQMETFSALLALCAWKSPVTGEFPSQRPQWHLALVFFFICALNKQLSKQSGGWWFETPSRSLWSHCDVRYWPNSAGIFL